MQRGSLFLLIYYFIIQTWVKADFFQQFFSLFGNLKKCHRYHWQMIVVGELFTAWRIGTLTFLAFVVLLNWLHAPVTIRLYPLATEVFYF